MTDFFHRVSYWKLAIWKGVNGAVTVGIMSWLGSTNAIDWSSLHLGEKWAIGLTALVAVTKYIDGFLDTTMSSLRNGRQE